MIDIYQFFLEGIRLYSVVTCALFLKRFDKFIERKKAPVKFWILQQGLHPEKNLKGSQLGEIEKMKYRNVLSARRAFPYRSLVW
jgi:hypothetical protein